MSKNIPKPRFKLGTDPHNWKVIRGHWSPKQGDYVWTPESYHSSLPHALRFLHDRLLRDGYTPEGLEALAAKVEASYDRLKAYAEELMENREAELEP